MMLLPNDEQENILKIIRMISTDIDSGNISSKKKKELEEERERLYKRFFDIDHEVRNNCKIKFGVCESFSVNKIS